MSDKLRFISYHENDSGTRRVPIATGHSREECQSLAIVRTLSACELNGRIYTQDRTADVDLQTFTQLTQFLNVQFMVLDASNRGNKND